MKVSRTKGPEAGPTRASSDSYFAMVAAVIAVFALLVYTYLIHIYSLNIPFGDDIFDVLNFLLQFEQANTWQERLQLLFAQHNDHRTAASRIVYYLVLKLNGEIDFRVLTLVAGVAILLLCYLYALPFKNLQGKCLAFGIAALLHCNPMTLDNGNLWSTAAFAFCFSVAYAFASLSLLAHPNWLRVALAGLFALASTFTLSSGQITWLVGGVWLTFQWRRGGNHAFLIAWILMAVLSLVAFHYEFSTPNTISNLLGTAALIPAREFQYFVALLGAGAGFGSLGLSMCIGTGILLTLAWLSTGRIGTGTSVFLAFAWYLVLSCAAIALGRAPYSAPEDALSSRYSIFSISLLVVLLSLAAIRLRGLVYLPHTLILLTAVASGAHYLLFLDSLDAHAQQRIRSYNSGLYPVYGYPLAQTRAIVEAAASRGIYTPPIRPLRLPATPFDDLSLDSR